MFLWFIVLSVIIAKLKMSFWWSILLSAGYLWYVMTKASKEEKDEK